MPSTDPGPAPAHPRTTAADIMTAGPRSCSPFSTVTEAVMLFRDHDCGSVPVLDAGKPVGILTDRDVALAAAKFPDLPARPVSEVMTADVVTVPADAPLGAVREAFGENQVRRLVVVDPSGQLVGIIAWSDLVPALPAEEVGHVVSEVVDRPPASAAPADAPPAPAARDDGGPGGSWLAPKGMFVLIRRAAHEWSEDKAPRLGAALAFYSVLSLAPLLLIAIAVAGIVFDRTTAQGHLLDQIRDLVGKEGAEAVEEMLAHAHRTGGGWVAAAVGVLTLVFAATGVVAQLQDALDTIWEVAPRPGRGILGVVKDRIFSLGMVLGFGFLLLISLLLSTLLNAFGGLISLASPLGEVANFAVSLVVITLLFAVIFKLIPDAKVAWRDVGFGAVVTAALFMVGKTAIGVYLGRSGLGSAYGAAGSLVVLLVWAYYSSQILFFGAELTQVYANRVGSRIVPSAGAVPVTERARAQQGMPRADDLKSGPRPGGTSLR